MHVNPLASDGQFTIGYDADGVAGMWDGNMAETTNFFIPAKDGVSFHDGNEEWDCFNSGDGELVWRDGG